MTEEVEQVDVTELMGRLDTLTKLTGEQQNLIDSLSADKASTDEKLDQLLSRMPTTEDKMPKEDDAFDPEAIVTQADRRADREAFRKELKEMLDAAKNEPARQNREAIITASAPTYAKLRGTKEFEAFLESQNADEFGTRTLADVEKDLLEGSDYTKFEALAEKYEAQKPSADDVGQKRDYGSAPKITKSREELQDDMEAAMARDDLKTASDIGKQLDAIPI